MLSENIFSLANETNVNAFYNTETLLYNIERTLL